MNALSHEAAFSRRHFLHQIGCGFAVCAAGGFVPRLLAAGPTEPRALILIQLEGGHDGLSTFVPLEDEAYYRLRPTLALPRRDLTVLGGAAGLSPAGRGLEPLFKEGKLTVLPQVGYTDPSPSHFRSAEIWHTASAADERLYSGWLGRSLAICEAQARLVTAGYGGRALPRILVREEDLAHGGRPGPGDLRRPLAQAGGEVAVQLAEIGERAAGGAATEFYFVTVPGFDTHFDQADRHAARLAATVGALRTLQQRLERRGVAERVLTVVFSEFGRSVAENGQGGTDHGDSGPVLLLGPRVRGGFRGRDAAPLDFRRILATVVDRWLQVPPIAVLGRHYDQLDLLS